ncbi:MAG: hypothetical protein AAB895_01735, partial [Patescibacteria group bacterium]
MQHGRKIIYLAGFLFSLPIALASYINSSFISSFTGEKLVGIVYALGSILSIIALLLAPKIIPKVGGSKFLLGVVFLDALSFLGLVFVQSPLILVMLFILGISLNTLVVFSLDEILKIFSQNENTGKIRGSYLAICNLAWILAQVASGTVLGAFSFRAIYFISFLVMTSLLLTSFLKLRNIPDPKYDKDSTIKYLGNFFRNFF